ncbi:hypothetical protein SPHINGOT1_210002 [Sphingomonas sp. T1]|nr:hypothetical protein SPHINGOT1_210002 [Sphingomonas sp. T1]
MFISLPRNKKRRPEGRLKNRGRARSMRGQRPHPNHPSPSRRLTAPPSLSLKGRGTLKPLSPWGRGRGPRKAWEGEGT